MSPWVAGLIGAGLGATASYLLCMDVLEDMAAQRDHLRRAALRAMCRPATVVTVELVQGPRDQGRALLDEIEDGYALARMAEADGHRG